MNKLKTPYGVQDFLPNECFVKNAAEGKLARVFEAYGYRRVETPTFEYYDIFEREEHEKIRAMFKMTDNDGSLLVLRPDPTLQICRLASKLDLSGVNKLYYLLNSFEYLPNTYSSRTREFAQAGVELLGKSGLYGDAEIIIMAIEALKSAGLKNFLVEIGHVGYFKGLVKDAGLKNEDATDLRALVSNKDTLELERFLQSSALNEEIKHSIMGLPMLFGGAEVLKKAEFSAQNAESLRAVRELETLFSALEAAGVEKYVGIDLGMLQGMNYYSGIIIRGSADGLGQPILEGGRYDKIGDSFNKGMDAVGFAVGIKRLLMALEGQGALETPHSADEAVASEEKARESAVKYAASLRAKGLKVTDLFVAGREKLIEYATKSGIKRTAYFTSNSFKPEITEIGEKKC